MFKKLALTFIGLAVTAQFAFGLNFNVDKSHSQVGFEVTHMVFFTVEGFFTDFAAQISANPEDRSIQSIKATIQSNTVDTRVARRDGDLRSQRFFDVENHPTLSFVSKQITGKGDNITVVGDLTIKGVTKSVTLNGAYLGTIMDPWKNHRAGFKGTGTINRKDFGLLYNDVLETGGAIVSDEVKIVLDIQAVSPST